MTPIDKNYYVEMMGVFAKWQGLHQQYLSCLEQQRDLQQLADIVYTLKEIHKLTEEINKRVNGTVGLAERLLCLLWAQGEDGEPVRTEHCTCSPKVKQSANLPKKGTEEYENLLVNYFKVPPEMVGLDAVRPHWPGVVDLLTELATNGKPLPPGIDPSKVYHVYSVTVLKKKGITE